MPICNCRMIFNFWQQICITVIVSKTKSRFCFHSLLVLFRKQHKLFWKRLSPLAKWSTLKPWVGERMERSRNWYSYRFPIKLGFRTCFPKHSRGCSVQWHLQALTNFCYDRDRSSRLWGTALAVHTAPARAVPALVITRGFITVTPASLEDEFPAEDFTIFPAGCQQEPWKHSSVLCNFSITCCNAYNELKDKTALQQIWVQPITN